MTLHDRWRPRLWLVLALVLASVMALPFAGLYFLRVYENALVQQAEGELIGQAAVLAALYRREIAAHIPAEARRGAAAPPPSDEMYQPVTPVLDLTADTMLPQRPDALPAASPPAPAYLEIGAALQPVIAEAQRMTLAGFRLLDANGVVIGGREEVGQSLAHVEEAARALKGEFASVLRLRVPRHEAPPLYSMSRGTHVRVFVAAPVVLDGHVAGVVYASRTPSNIVKQLYEQREKLALAGALISAIAALIGYVFYRAISGPVHVLVERADAIARGDSDALAPIPMHGTAEFAHLADSLLAMARELRRRADYMSTFAAHVSHELKSPLTAIQGAAELMRDSEMSEKERARFLDNIIADSARLSTLLQKLRDLARAEKTPLAGSVRPGEAVAALSSAFPAFAIDYSGEDRPLRISADSLGAILTQLADNARQHGATRLKIDVTPVSRTLARLVIADDGPGVSPNNRDRIFDSFFTTRREDGGTGMGLAIVRALAHAHGGEIELAESRSGAAFVLTLPLA